MTVGTAKDWIGALIDDIDTAPRNYELAAAMRYGIPLYGHALVEQWQEKVTSYPTNLAIKLVQENLWLGPWFNWTAYAQRADHIVLAQHLVWMQQRMINLLAALNREYLPSPEFKWVDRLIEELQIKPSCCAARMRTSLTADEMSEAVQGLIELGLEVIDLVEAHLPEVNETSQVENHPEVNTNWARQRWAPEPAYTLVADIARGELDDAV